MGFGPGPFDGWEERARIHRDLRMATDVVNLLEKIQKRNDERFAALRSIIYEWIESIGSKIVTILKGIKTHLSKWVSVKVSSTDSDYINDYFNDRIKIFSEMTWVEKSDEFDVVVNNLTGVKYGDEDSIRSAVNKWLKTVGDRLEVVVEGYREHLHGWTSAKIGEGEAIYINELFDSEVKKVEGFEHCRLDAPSRAIIKRLGKDY